MVERVPSVGTQVGQNGPAGHEDGKRHQAHPGRCAHVGCLDVLPVHDEQGRGERGLIVAWRGGPVVPRVGSQAGRHSPGVTRAKLAATTLPTASGAMADSPQLKARSDLAVGTDHSSSLSRRGPQRPVGGDGSGGLQPRAHGEAHAPAIISGAVPAG